jgi:putrescine importer
MATTTTTTNAAPQLRRTLGLWDLVLYGIIVIQPVAPMSVFGVLSERSRGHVVTTILIAMVAMLFTAISYGRMARAYPSSGSAFTYVGKEIHPAGGFVTGWSMAMDYMLNPMICIIWCSKAMLNLVPGIPYMAWTVFFFLLFTLLNLRGIRASARTNAVLAAGMGAVVVLFFVAAVRYIFQQPLTPADFARPFYDPQTFSIPAVLGGTSIAVLTYIGFDGISTLSEEAKNPRRNILLATVFTCVAIGLLAALQVYAAQLVWPSSQPFPDVDTAFVHVAGKAAGPWFFGLITFTLLTANIGSGTGAHLGAARLLYGMGRSKALPQKFFGVLDVKRQIPRNNVIFVGVVALIGANIISFGLGAEMLNFGALIAFMGVNLAAFMHYFVRGTEKRLTNFLPPLLGLAVCFLLWISLSTPAKLAGAGWLAVGLIFGAVKTRGFKSDLVDFELPNDEPQAAKSPD